jgi:hypothetical protein
MSKQRMRNRQQPEPKYAGSGFLGGPAPGSRAFLDARRLLERPPAEREQTKDQASAEPEIGANVE